MNTKRLTNSEKQIMEVLWKSDVPLSSLLPAGICLSEKS